MEQKLKLKRRSSKKQIIVVESKSKRSVRVALFAVQKQLQLLKLKEYLLLAGFTLGGALLRVPMQEVPSAEPITFFAILAGWIFGKNKGFVVGASAAVISNFFCFGGQGPWTPFQMLGWGIAGYLGGFLGKNSGIFRVLIVTFLATAAFEIVMNSATPLMTGGNILMIFVLALPFILVHMVSNLLFCGFLPFAKKIIEKKGGFNEKEYFTGIYDKYKHNLGKLLPGKNNRAK